MMASVLPVIVSKNNKQTEKYVSYCGVSQIHINNEKKTWKKHQNDWFECRFTQFEYGSYEKV